MAYLLFRYKGWNPSRYYSMGRGEKDVLKGFMEVEIEERKEIEKQSLH